MSDSPKSDTKKKKETSTAKKPVKQEAGKAKADASKSSGDAGKSVEKGVAKSAARKTSNFLLWLVVVCLLLALGVIAYFGWQFIQEQNAKVASLESRLESQQEEQAASLASTTKQQSTLIEKQQRQLAEFKTQFNDEHKAVHQRLENHAERLQALTGNSRTVWILEEARYLLRLANQRQLTGGNSSGILGLLEEADKLLLNADSPDVFPIRNSLRKDILAIKVAPKVDREGLYLQLLALSAQLSALPAAPIKTPEIEVTSNNSEAEAALPWHQVVLNSIKGAFSNLDKYVRVNHHDEPIEPLLSRQQQGIMAANLLLMMEQAQAALLKEEQVVYEQSLSKVVDWLGLHYQHFEQSTALINEIKILQSENVVSVVPKVSASLKLLTDYIKQQDNVDTKATSNSNKKSAKAGAAQ